MVGFPCRESNRIKERPRRDRHIELKCVWLRVTMSGRVYMKRVPGEGKRADQLTKCNDELTCVVGAPMKSELLQQGDRTWQEQRSPRGVNFARRVRAAEAPVWCPSAKGGLVRHNITGGAVMYEKVGQQMQHNPRRAGESRWVSRNRAAAGE